jgi:hypothetical protein
MNIPKKVEELKYLNRIYLEAPPSKAKDTLDKIKDIWGKFGEALASTDSNQGINFLIALYDKEGYRIYFEEWSELTGKLSKTKSTSRRKELTKRTTLLKDILSAPLGQLPDLYAREWKKTIPFSAVQLRIEVGDRPSTLEGFTPKRERDDDEALASGPITPEEIAEAEKEEQEKQAKKDDLKETREENKKAEENKYEVKRQQQERENPFEPTEIISETTLVTRDADQVEWLWTPSSESQEDGDVQLQAMVNEFAQQAFSASPSVATMWLLRNQAEFWIEEFLNFVVAPCEYKAEFKQMQDMRVQLMVPLLKMRAALEKSIQEGTPAKFAVIFATPLFQPWEWREILSTLFPLTAMVYFREIPASGQAQSVYAQAQYFINANNKNVIPWLHNIACFESLKKSGCQWGPQEVKTEVIEESGEAMDMSDDVIEISE